jgi:hypothetical protein
MWQTKYASAVPKNLGLGLNFWPFSEGYFLSGGSVVRGAAYDYIFTYILIYFSESLLP